MQILRQFSLPERLTWSEWTIKNFGHYHFTFNTLSSKNDILSAQGLNTVIRPCEIVINEVLMWLWPNEWPVSSLIQIDWR